MKRKIVIIAILFTLSLTVMFCSRLDSDADKNTGTDHAVEKAHLYADSSKEIVLSREIISDIGLKVETVETVPNASFVSAKGLVIPRTANFARVGTLLPGRVAAIHKNIGDRVNAGDPLFEISSLQISEMVSGFIVAKTQLDVAKTNFSRTERLYKDGIGSEKDFLAIKSELQIAEGNFKAADNRIHSIGFTDDEIEQILSEESHSFNTLKVKSPISGTVTKMNISLGQFITEEETAFEISDSRKLWVQISLSEKDFRAISVGNKIEVLSPFTQKIHSGKLIQISNAIDPVTRTIELIGEVKSDGLIANSFVDVNILLSGGSTLAVPEMAVQIDGEDRLVFVEDESNSFQVRKIITGNRFRNYVQVLSGLGVGEKVVTEGSFFLKAKFKEGEFETDND